MMIYHFLIALVVAVILMPKGGASLNELNHTITKKLQAEPTYLIRLEDKEYELDYWEREIINPQWIDKVELYKRYDKHTSQKAGSAVVLVSLKKRKLDDFWTAIEENHIQL